MESIKFDLNNRGGAFKMLNCTNGGPWHKRHANDQYRSNFEDYKALRIPYSRNHDSALFQIYGGPYSHDITCIFPYFDADPTLPESYDFACTDEAIQICLEAGTKTFFRLGQTIEHQIKKHGTMPPKDFKKWAVICEHIIRHYTEGWADGFHYDMPYWEIWNEPDLHPDDDAPHLKQTWGGTQAQFFDFYEIAAKHLKSCFPHLKIGGPALGWNFYWGEKFLKEMKARGVEIDFFSWHTYTSEPKVLGDRARNVKDMLIRTGYENAEKHLNEWNYVRGWQEDFQYSINTIHSLKGASFLHACICEAQKAPLDMLMYYDTRPSVFNGIFDYYSYEPLKGYYPMLWYSMFYELEAEIPAVNNVENIYSLCGVGKDGKVMATLTNYSEKDDSPEKEITVDFGRKGTYEIYLVDKEHDGVLVRTVSEITLRLPLHSCVLIKEI